MQRNSVSVLLREIRCGQQEAPLASIPVSQLHWKTFYSASVDYRDQSGNFDVFFTQAISRFKYSIFLVLLHSYLFSKKLTPLCRKLNSQKDLKETIRGEKDQNLEGEDEITGKKVFPEARFSVCIGCGYTEKKMLQLFKNLGKRNTGSVYTDSH